MTEYPSPPAPASRGGAPSAPSAYRAPQETYRPVSALAVVALVLAIAFLVPALAGPWWAEAVPVVVAALAWRRAGRRGLRGRGAALAAIVVAVLVGGFSFVGHRSIEAAAGEQFDSLARALDSGRPEEVAKWVAKGEEPTPAVERWSARMRAAHAEAGAYAGRFRVGSVVWGSLAHVLAAPAGVGEELAPAGTGRPEPLRTFWARAEFEKGTLWFAFVLGAGGEAGGAYEALVKGVNHRDTRYVRDVRIFRDSGG